MFTRDTELKASMMSKKYLLKEQIHGINNGVWCVEIQTDNSLQEYTSKDVILIENHSNKFYEIGINNFYRIVCTPDTEFLTEHGWKKASELNKLEYMRAVCVDYFACEPKVTHIRKLNCTETKIVYSFKINNKLLSKSESAGFVLACGVAVRN